MYRTGDLARYLPDGTVEFLGRGDDQIKIRGFRIELGEIEAILAKRAGVKQAIVLAREDDRGDKRLIGYVVTDGERAGSSDDLRAYLKHYLPEYMVPAAVILLPKLPLTANGKVDRQALPAPEAVVKRVHVEPKTPTEMLIAKVWSEVLGRDQISCDDNFFDLGGHSLLAVRALGELEKAVGRRIPMASLFRGATIESLARILNEGSEDEPEPMVMELRAGDGNKPLFLVASPGVRAIGYALLARHIDPNQSMYKLQGQEPVVLGRPFLVSELDTLATQYVAALRSVQPRGPYYFGAMCGGCQIVERMIVQLEALGEEVALFIVFDTWVLEHVRRRWRVYLYNNMQRLKSLRKLTVAENADQLTTAARNRVRILTGKKKDRPWDAAYWPTNFVPPHFHAPILLFKRAKQPFYYIHDPIMGWDKRTDRGVQVQEMATDRHRILREPFVQSISAKISAFLRPSFGSPEPVAEPLETVNTPAAAATSM